MKNISKLLLTSSAAFLLAACGDTTTEEPAEEAPVEEEATEQTDPTGTVDNSETADAETVTVNMLNNDGEEVGTAIFEETEEGVTLELSLEGIPAGEYGMHIHEVGMATPPTFVDAGSHFNPTDVEHGANSETGPHIGDLPNLVVPEDGVVEETIDIPDTTLQADGENTLNSEQGTSLIVHTDADDYESQPTGDAGDRMLGGVIFPGNEQ
ncbi:superoxide dismutase family protein [Carnobacteriaceae bacterium 52-44]